MKIKKSFLSILLIYNIGLSSEICKTNSDELLSQLVTNHPSIKMSQETINTARENINSAFWGFFPTPSIDYSYRDNDRKLTTARLEQPIWTGGKLTSNYDIANSKEKETIYGLQETSYKLIEDFLNTLNTYMQSKANLIELEEGLNNLNRFDEMLDRRREAGISSDSDKNLLNARIEQINSEIMLANNRYKVSKMQLELMLDKNITCDIDLRNIILKFINIEDSINSLIINHPSIKKAQMQIQTIKYELDSKKASYMPNLTLRAEHRDGDLYYKDVKDDNQDLVYLNLNANFGAGLSAMSEIKASKLKINEIEYYKKSLEKELIDGLLNDYNNYEITKNRIKVVDKSIVSSQNVLDSYTRLFLASKRQWIDLVNASKELMEYKIELSTLKVSKDILAYKLALKNGQIDLLNGETK